MTKGKKTSLATAVEERVELPDCLSDLTLKQAKFVLALSCNGGHQGNAARAAGYSPASADVTVCRMLKSPKIQKARRELLSLVITPERLIETIAAFAFKNDLADYVPRLALMRDKGLDTRLVKKVKFNEDGSLAEIEMHSPQKAQDQLIQALGVGKQAEPDNSAKTPAVSYNNVEKIEILLVQGPARPYHPEYKMLGSGGATDTSGGSEVEEECPAGGGGHADLGCAGVDDGPAEDR